MKLGIACAIGLLAGLLAAPAFCAPHGGAPSPDSGALQQQLHRTKVELRRQRGQSVRLRTRVNQLEQRSAADRAQLEQRDREIAELERNLTAAATESAPASTGSH